MHIAVFYHALFSHGTPREFRPGAFAIVEEAMAALEKTGLAARADEIHFCFNGPEEDRQYAELLAPAKAQIVCHGPNSFAENLTIVRAWEWCKSHPNWYVLYFHGKGATHDPTHPYTAFATQWRHCMLRRLVFDWRNCVEDLNSGAEMVCCHWLVGMADGTQNIPAGNFLWVRSDFVNLLPSMHLRQRIIDDGIAAASSRYEAEVFWGNGPRLPSVVDKHPGPPCSG